MDIQVNKIIQNLELIPHPEGGYYREIYRSKETMQIHNKIRNFCTSIYYLLEKNNFSAFHRISSDEIWHFYIGSPVRIHILDEFSKKYQSIILGSEYNFQYVVSKNLWFCAELVDKTSFSLIGCTVSPGFDFKDFELARKEYLLEKFPDYKELIEKFCIL